MVPEGERHAAAISVYGVRNHTDTMQRRVGLDGMSKERVSEVRMSVRWIVDGRWQVRDVESKELRIADR